MSRHRRFCDGAGFTCHCWECGNSTDWHGEIGRCGQHGIAIGKYDSPNNGCSKAGGCGYYAHDSTMRTTLEPSSHGTHVMWGHAR